MLPKDRPCIRFTVFPLVQALLDVTDADVYRHETDLMIYAEELGFDAVWIAEHHSHSYCITPDPLLLATHIASRTKRIRIGTAANLLSAGTPDTHHGADGNVDRGIERVRHLQSSGSITSLSVSASVRCHTIVHVDRWSYSQRK